MLFQKALGSKLPQFSYRLHSKLYILPSTYKISKFIVNDKTPRQLKSATSKMAE